LRLLFLSHSGDDKAYAKTLSEKLTEWGYESVFVYWDRQSGIAGGTDWTRELYQKLRLTGALVAVYSPAYFASKWCFAELTAARLFGGERVLEGRWSLATDDDRRIVRVQDAGGASVSHLRHDAKVSVFRFSLDGRSVVTASEDGLVRVWLWRPDDLLERACQVVSRGELTDEEWQDAFGSGPRRTTCPAKTP
jgi:WD40 repeat protein